MTQQEQEITVQVPKDRVGDFYRWFGSWLDGVEQHEPGDQSQGYNKANGMAPWDPSKDWELAVELWGKLSANARRMLSYLIDHPTRRIDGDELAEALEIPHGKYGIAGVLAWPGRYCIAMGRNLPINWDDDGYWVDRGVAKMFAKIIKQSGVAA
jgi:Family of unknown function (DUF6416)